MVGRGRRDDRDPTASGLNARGPLARSGPVRSENLPVSTVRRFGMGCAPNRFAEAVSRRRDVRLQDGQVMHAQSGARAD